MHETSLRFTIWLLLKMGSNYGSSDLATITASDCAHGPLITISHCLIMGIDYGSLRSLNPYNVLI